MQIAKAEAKKDSTGNCRYLKHSDIWAPTVTCVSCPPHFSPRSFPLRKQEKLNYYLMIKALP